MFTMAKIRNGSTYLGNHLAANDYYSEKESVTGEWVGRAAEQLGLAGRRIRGKDEAFERLRKNRHPLTGRKLTPRMGVGRIVFLDFQCSAPKSVSMLAVTFGDDRLRAAHQEAVTAAFSELERFAARRVRNGAAAWSEQTAITGNLCAARFEHDASRALDAQLHTHLVTANATFDQKADCWFALTEREMLCAIRYAGKVYQNGLARRVLAAGYEIETIQDARGAVEGFEIAGITLDERARASKRRAQIEKEIAAFEAKHGREPTTREVHAMTTATRGEKLTEITTAEVRRRQRAEIAPERVREIDQLVAEARRRHPTKTPADTEARVLKGALDHLFERASVQQGHEILAEALNQDLGHIDLDKLKATLLEGKGTDCVPLARRADPLHTPYATREGLAQELDAIGFVNGSRGRYAPLGFPDFEPHRSLSDEQYNVVKAVLDSTDTVCAVRGVAGTGKTTLLKELHRGLGQMNREVIACAPTTSAAQELREAGFAKATTLADFLQRARSLRYGDLGRGTALIVDEAGIAGTRQGAALFETVSDHGLRLILVGDSRQHSGVEAGDFLSVLERHSRLRTFELKDIRRQSDRDYRAAVKLMAQGQAHAGLKAIDRLGWLHEAGGNYIRRAAEHYVGNLAVGRETILVAPTWEEIHRLTDAVRSELKAREILGAGEVITVAEPLSLTKAQAARAGTYRPGHLLALHRSIHEAGLTNGTTVEVVGVSGSRLLVHDQRGGEHVVSPARQSQAWTVASPRRIEVAPGDRILIRQNHRRSGLVNGEVLTIEAREADGAWLARDARGRERQIPGDFRAFVHGYAVTSHKAQGRTADEVIVCAARLDTKAAYVSFSRARQAVTGYTPDKAALFDALPNVHRPREAAVDLWTPARVGRLRWARQVIERVRQALAPRVPPVELTVSLAPVDPVQKEAADEAPRASRSRRAGRGYRSSSSPQEGMRISM